MRNYKVMEPDQIIDDVGLSEASTSRSVVMEPDRIIDDVGLSEASTSRSVGHERYFPDDDDYNWQPNPRPHDPDMSYSEILSGPLVEELRVDSGSEEEDEPMSLEELRATLEDTAEDVEEDPEEHERLSEPFNWSSDYSTFRGQPEVYSQASERGPNIEETDPLKPFTHVWDHDIMNTIVAQTNEYAWQTIAQASESPDGISAHSRLNDWVETSTDELYKLFAVMIFMSLMVAGRVSE